MLLETLPCCGRLYTCHHLIWAGEACLWKCSVLTDWRYICNTCKHPFDHLASCVNVKLCHKCIQKRIPAIVMNEKHYVL